MRKTPLALVMLLTAGAQSWASEWATHFGTPPDSARPWTFWFWVNGNVSKEGIRADLEDMKRVGIGGAMLFDGSMYLPPGPIRYGSDAWHDHVQYAIALADELGLQIGVMNCAGWATAGGPWNSLEQSMKMLVWSEQTVAGGKRWEGLLPSPPSRENFYRDVAVWAVREPLPLSGLREVQPPSTVTLTFEREVKARTLILPGTLIESLCSGKIEVSEDGKTYRLIHRFQESTKNWPGQVAIPIPSTTARIFRVSFDKTPTAALLKELQLLATSRLEQLPAKTGLRPVHPHGPAEEIGIPLQEVIDLGGRMDANGVLRWDVPSGQWTILRFGYTTTAQTNHPAVPEGTGWEVDKFDAKAVAHHFENGLGRIIREAGPHLGRSLTGVVSDSWEAGPQNWTAAMPRLFEERRGYVPGPYLACLAGRVIGSVEKSEAFLRDFRKTLGDLYAEKYFGTMARLAHEHGLLLMSEGYGGVLNEFKVDATLDVPAVEFWNHNLYKSCGIVTSVAHTTGKPLVMAEAFTSRPPEHSRWTETPYSLKVLGDTAFTLGINRFALHSYVHQPRSDIAPGFTHGRYGSQFGRLNSWWPLADGWIDYLKRCQFLLQQGTPASDLLYLVPDRLQTEQRDLNFPWPDGYRGDYLSVHQLAPAKVENGRIRIQSDVLYRALVLPGECHLTLDELRELGRLRREGAKILGSLIPRPSGLSDLNNPDWLAQAALWKDTSPTEPDFAPDFQAGSGLNFFHRIGEGFDVYFVSNPLQKAVETTASFRVVGREPELWDPASGRMETAPTYEIGADSTRIPLSLDPAGSVFVVFRRPAFISKKTAISPLPEELLRINGPWKISFQPRRGAPESLTLDALQSLSAHSDPGVRYFSGLATYTKEIDVPTGVHRAMLDLGVVHDLAEVTINGERAGIVWKPPFVVDVTPLLRPGKNSLSITVANRWNNRLIGDEALPRDAEYLTGGEVDDHGGRNPGALKKLPAWWNDPAAVKSRARITFPTWKHYEGNEPLVPSGLLGPVTLRLAK